jgi:hypothetical protein
LEHVIPKARGGPDTSDNFVEACSPCNISKGDKLPSEWSKTKTHKKALTLEAELRSRYTVLPRVRKGRQLIAPSITALARLHGACLLFREAISEAQRETFPSTYLGKLLYKADRKVHSIAVACTDLSTPRRQGR